MSIKHSQGPERFFALPLLVKVLLVPVALIVLLTVFGAIVWYPWWRIGALVSTSIREAARKAGATESSRSAMPESMWYWLAPIVVASGVSLLTILAIILAFTASRKSPLRDVFRVTSRIFMTSLGCSLTAAVGLVVFEVVNAFVPSTASSRAFISASVIGGAVLVVSAAGIANALSITVFRLRIPTSKVTRAVRIAHISDVHIGSRGGGWMRRVAAAVEREKPDVIAITGDLFDLPCIGESEFAPLGALGIPIIAVFGNHELIVGEARALEVMKAIDNTRLLRHEATTLGEIDFIGVEDGAEDDTVRAYESISSKVAAAGGRRFTVLLHHRPHGFPQISSLPNAPDLFLSGHTHA